MTTTVARVHGALILDELKVIGLLHGEHVARATLAAMPTHFRAEIEGMLPITWVTADAADAIFIALAKVLGRPLFEVHAEIVRKSVSRTLHTVWRALLHFTTDEALVRRTPIFYSRTCDVGELTSKIVARGRSEIRLVGHPTVSDLLMNGIGVGIATVLEHAGRKDVRVTRERTPAGAVFTATWKK
jgi:hypothetical protein